MIFIASFVAALLLLIAAVLASAYYPKDEQKETVISLGDAPLLSKEKPIKILSYNVQFMAGKDYVFWFDVPEGDGPDTSPSPDVIRKTTQDVANIIIDENPDFIFLQEVDDGAKRTGKQDQLKALLALLPETYRYHTSAFYWKSGFVPHPRILGRAGMKLSTLSKHPIASAKRHQLALTPDNPIAKHLGIKRAVLEAHIPYAEGSELVLLNTHLEAFSKQSDTLQKQVNHVRSLLNTFSKQNIPWVIGGDFNLLPPNQYDTQQPRQHVYYRPDTELCDLTDQFPCIPSIADIKENPTKWHSFYSNDPEVTAPDRTLDYLFHSPLLTCVSKTVRQHDTSTISDHFPVIASFSLEAYTQ
ncbi:MAG: endonuclease/exonuclease/phosphatase family protein [Cycloclasticus sp.]